MSFTLTRKDAPHNDAVNLHVFPLEIECSAGTPREIFVYQRGYGAQEGLNDRFSCVASALQVRTLPVNSPTTDEGGSIVPFFRKSTLRVDARDAAHAEYIWTEVVRQVRDLSENLRAGEALTLSTTVVIP
jgi:hypothetical protein